MPQANTSKRLPTTNEGKEKQVSEEPSELAVHHGTGFLLANAFP